MVLLHSRKAFTNMANEEEGKFLCFCWALESMYSHRMQKVVFELDDVCLVGLVNRPQTWPSFGFQAAELLLLLSAFEVWKVVKGNLELNRGTTLIAQSVTMDCRLQSYVAVSHPFWLNGVFENERVLSSL
uniref:RNase H type-1 domain-containing protein n=1 Tax=Noccaea caerulescens TaxID=107243 RepID=A0A1J3CVL7_NOCCA